MATGGMFSDGAAYERLMGRWSRVVGDVFVEWLGAAKDLRWLDVGCGTGVFTEQIATRCAPASLAAIDPSAEQLAFARTRAPLAGTDFRVGDAQTLPFPDASLDAAVMALVIHFVPEPPKALAEMARVLTPGGLAAAYVWDYETRGAPNARLLASVRAIGLDTPAPPSARATSLAALDALWRGAGFTAVETRTIRIPVVYASFDEYWDSMTVPAGPAGQVIARMDAETRARLRAALLEATPPAPDGRIVYEAAASAIKGRKAA